MTLEKKYIFFYYGLLVLCGAGYIYLSLNAPASTSTRPEFQITSPLARSILKCSFLIPLLLTWFFGIGTIIYTRLCSLRIPEKSFRNMFCLLCMGASCLLFGMIFASLLGQVRTYHPTDPDIQRIVTISVNYIYVFSSLLGFISLFLATRNIQTKKETLTTPGQNALVGMIYVTVIALLWAALIFTNTSRQVQVAPDIKPSFYLSDIFILLTILLPTVVAWFFGILAALNLSDLVPHTQNEERRRYFGRLINGLWLLLFSSLILNGIQSAGGERLISLGLVGVLIIVYFFIFVILLSYWLTSSSAQKICASETFLSYESEK